jgi:hypothetical protein
VVCGVERVISPDRYAATSIAITQSGSSTGSARACAIDPALV